MVHLRLNRFPAAPPRRRTQKSQGKAPETRREGTKRAIYTDYEEINLFTG